MRRQIFLFVALIFLIISSSAQSDSNSGTFWKPNPRNYHVKQAFEIESLVPMFFTGGYHFAVGYRYEVVRIGARLWRKYQ